MNDRALALGASAPVFETVRRDSFSLAPDLSSRKKPRRARETAAAAYVRGYSDGIESRPDSWVMLIVGAFSGATMTCFAFAIWHALH